MTRGYVYGWAATFGAVCRDVVLTGRNATHLLKLVADTGLRTWAPAAQEFERWSRSMSTDAIFSAGDGKRPSCSASVGKRGYSANRPTQTAPVTI
jgi:hypothetical protein